MLRHSSTASSEYWNSTSAKVVTTVDLLSGPQVRVVKLGLPQGLQ